MASRFRHIETGEVGLLLESGYTRSGHLVHHIVFPSMTGWFSSDDVERVTRPDRAITS